MVTRKASPAPTLEQFWQAAFVAATWPILLAHDGKQLTPGGAAHLCADYADAAVKEFHTRFGS